MTLAAAVIAAPQVSSKRVRSAGENVAMARRCEGSDRRTPCRDRLDIVREPAEDVSECDHDRSSGSQIGHELVDGSPSATARVGSVRCQIDRPSLRC